MTSIWKSRAWIVIEPIILLLVFGLLAREIVALVSGDPGAADRALAQPPPDWAALAFLEGRSHLVKWGLLLLAAGLLARARGFRVTRPLGKRASPLPFWQLLLFGLAIAIPLHLLSILPRWYHFTIAPLGDTPAIWNLIYGSEWTAEFWIFMAISSFVVVPVVEELFFRGYVLGSLGQRFSPVWAIVLSALIFAIVHTQYVRPDGFALFNLATVFLVGGVCAWSVYATRSLIPALVSHAFGNLPQPLEWAPFESALLIPAAMVLIWLWPRLRLDPSG
ncbi:CAAX protease self-immunity [Parasphingorhabdus marina DSM 22363]|uniref:CAAX protease self-immunity n=1 Tax=Parasphingorhabdus marina DSM 22363 TaxID=1123272 RepID=A0A1N6H0P0_9SPHN|nr:type II CAAX endopeptidase family protein [Parasphingorhabdus marina]SIO13381.1 CAAX protease self-immunity [Parasphingorhabdus marina DSM 22363]